MIQWAVEYFNFSKLMKIILATEKSHLDQERNYLHPTKKETQTTFEEFPDIIHKCTNNLFLDVLDPIYDKSD